MPVVFSNSKFDLVPFPDQGIKKLSNAPRCFILAPCNEEPFAGQKSSPPLAPPRIPPK